MTLPYANIFQGRYRYTADLLAMDALRQFPPPTLPSRSCSTSSPLSLQSWCCYLAKHTIANYLYHGISTGTGFHIGFNYSSPLLPACRNMSSVHNNSTVVDNTCIKEELQEGRLVTIPSNSLASIQLSPFGVIPKHGQPNKWRLIIDLRYYCPCSQLS